MFRLRESLERMTLEAGLLWMELQSKWLWMRLDSVMSLPPRS